MRSRLRQPDDIPHRGGRFTRDPPDLVDVCLHLVSLLPLPQFNQHDDAGQIAPDLVVKIARDPPLQRRHGARLLLPHAEPQRRRSQQGQREHRGQRPGRRAHQRGLQGREAHAGARVLQQDLATARQSAQPLRPFHDLHRAAQAVCQGRRAEIAVIAAKHAVGGDRGGGGDVVVSLIDLQLGQGEGEDVLVPFQKFMRRDPHIARGRAICRDRERAEAGIVERPVRPVGQHPGVGESGLIGGLHPKSPGKAVTVRDREFGQLRRQQPHFVERLGPAQIHLHPHLGGRVREVLRFPAVPQRVTAHVNRRADDALSVDQVLPAPGGRAFQRPARPDLHARQAGDEIAVPLQHHDLAQGVGAIDAPHPGFAHGHAHPPGGRPGCGEQHRQVAGVGEILLRPVGHNRPRPAPVVQKHAKPLGETQR